MSGYRALTAQRLLAADADACQVGFSLKTTKLSSQTVFSPAMFLPAVVAQAEAMALFCFGSTDVVSVTRLKSDSGLFGVEVDTGLIDSSPEGLLRSALLIRASQQVFGFGEGQPKQLNIQPVCDYYLGDGLLAVLGLDNDILSDAAKQTLLTVAQGLEEVQ